MATTSKAPDSSGEGGDRLRLKRQGVLVLGMHRSGTSSVSGALVKLGLVGPKTPMEGRPDNPRGHWESEALAAFHDELLASAGSKWDDWRPFNTDWYETPLADGYKARGKALLEQEFGTAPAFVLKDPRICRFARFWLDVFADMGIEPKIILPMRSPLEVARSHHARDQFPIRKGLLLWLRHVLDAEFASRSLPQSLFEWNQFLADWRTTMERVAAQLGVVWPAITNLSMVEIDRFVSGDLKHEQVSDAELASHAELHAWVLDTYRALLDLTRDPNAPTALAVLDRVRGRFDEAAPLFGDALAEGEISTAELRNALRTEREVAGQAQAELQSGHEAQVVLEQRVSALLDERELKTQQVSRLEGVVKANAEEALQARALFEREIASLSERQAELEASTAETIRELTQDRDAYAERVRHMVELAEQARAGAEKERDALQDEYATALAAERSAKSEFEQRVRELHASRSWRLTAPMRAISVRVQRAANNGCTMRRALALPRRGGAFLMNVARAINGRRVAAALRSVSHGDWRFLWNRLRWFGQRSHLDEGFDRVRSEPREFAPSALPKWRNERNYWIPQKLRDYLSETYGEHEIEDITVLMDLVAAYGETDGVVETAPEFPRLMDWLKDAAGQRGVPPAPDISIVMPVHNKLALTLTAIASILRIPSLYSCEIIVADDCSSDGTAAAVSSIGGCVRHVANETNLRFVLNCNRAAEAARGKFIVMLNNDTLALSGWLDNLVGPLEKQLDVGLTGSKLLNNDGTLQEAGGILWKDGSAWNYGRNQDPRLSEFNYAKEVDYISGAAIALPVALWRRLGGFDPHFVPAYCEDSDLAFRVREAGLKVLYVPHSEIIHHEGMSHGRDTSQGMKAYQVTNTNKFAQRWHSTLQRDHFANGEHVFLARDRSSAKPHILFVDHYVPEWDRDAGSRSVFDCIRFFLQQGFQVTLWPDNLHRGRHYADTLQEMGVEIIFGSRHSGKFACWWRENGGYFPYVFLSRCHIATNYIDVIHDNYNSTVLYYGHDLPWKRLMLEHEATGSVTAKREAARLKILEDGVSGKVDYIIYPSREECEYARAAFPDAAGVIEMPGWNYERAQLEGAERTIATIPGNKSCRALFVGGFAHSPNGDGVRWFLDSVMPLVQARLSDFALAIVGSHMPDDIRDRASSAVEIKGWVSDAELDNLAAEAACTIAPLRFGAGVKGKVINAFAAGSPVVSTTVGMQGIDEAHAIAFVGDSAEEFADALVTCLTDRALARTKALGALDFVRRRYSPAAMSEAFAPILSRTFPQDA